MAKKKDIVVQHSEEFAGHIPTLIAYMKQGSVVPVVDNRYTGEPWVNFGTRNLWPEELAELVLNCAPLARCINALALMIAGSGDIKFFKRDGKTEVPEANKVLIDELLRETTVEEFVFRCAYDIAFLNAPSIVVRRDRGGDISLLDHLDVSRLRSGQVGSSGRPEEFYWSTDWARRVQKEAYRPEVLPRYQGDEVKHDRSVIYGKTYTPGRRGDEYAIPWWTGVIEAARTWAKVDAFNGTQIDTGFMAGMHLHTFTNRPDDQLKKYDQRVMNAYAGARARGYFHTYSAPGEGAPVLTPIPFSSYAGQMDEIRDGSASVIFQGYGMPGPLVNELTKTGMDGASTALIQAKALVEAMLVKPKQQLITKTLVRIMNDKGFKDVWEARIEARDFIDQGEDDVLARQAYLRSVTVDEYRKNVLGMDELGGEEGKKLLIESGSTPADTSNAAQ